MSLSDVVRYDVHAVDQQDYFVHGHADVVKRFAAAGVLAIPGMLVEVTVIAAD